MTEACLLSLSVCLIPGQEVDHHPNLLQEVPEASRVHVELFS